MVADPLTLLCIEMKNTIFIIHGSNAACELTSESGGVEVVDLVPNGDELGLPGHVSNKGLYPSLGMLLEFLFKLALVTGVLLPNIKSLKSMEYSVNSSSIDGKHSAV